MVPTLIGSVEVIAGHLLGPAAVRAAARPAGRRSARRRPWGRPRLRRRAGAAPGCGPASATWSGGPSSTLRAMPRSAQATAACKVRGSVPSGRTMHASAARARSTRLVAESGRAEPAGPCGAGQGLEPGRVQRIGDGVGHGFDPFQVVDRQALVEVTHPCRGLVAVVVDDQYRQAGGAVAWASSQTRGSGSIPALSSSAASRVPLSAARQAAMITS